MCCCNFDGIVFDAQASPSLPLQIVDFNSDGFNDIILVSRDGVYGYAQVRYISLTMYRCILLGQSVVHVNLFRWSLLSSDL